MQLNYHSTVGQGYAGNQKKGS